MNESFRNPNQKNKRSPISKAMLAVILSSVALTPAGCINVNVPAPVEASQPGEETGDSATINTETEAEIPEGHDITEIIEGGEWMDQPLEFNEANLASIGYYELTKQGIVDSDKLVGNRSNETCQKFNFKINTDYPYYIFDAQKDYSSHTVSHFRPEGENDVVNIGIEYRNDWRDFYAIGRDPATMPAEEYLREIVITSDAFDVSEYSRFLAYVKPKNNDLRISLPVKGGGCLLCQSYIDFTDEAQIDTLLNEMVTILNTFELK